MAPPQAYTPTPEMFIELSLKFELLTVIPSVAPKKQIAPPPPAVLYAIIASLLKVYPLFSVKLQLLKVIPVAEPLKAIAAP